LKLSRISIVADEDFDSKAIENLNIEGIELYDNPSPTDDNYTKLA